MIYADNAATTKISEAALNTLITHLNNTWGNLSSLYTVGQEAIRSALDDYEKKKK